MKSQHPTQDAPFIVVPAYNEARTIAALTKRICEFADNVIVVDDGSDDGTADALTGLPVQLVQHSENRGKGASIVSGILAAVDRGATSVITLDGDGQHQPKDIPRFIETSSRYPGKIIIGNRLANKDAIPVARYRANKVANFWISWACGYRISDSQSGFRLYPQDVLEYIKSRRGMRKDFVFESEILIQSARRGCRSVAIAIPALYFETGSRPSHFRPVADIAKIVRMVAWKIISKGMYPQGLYAVIRNTHL